MLLHIFKYGLNYEFLLHKLIDNVLKDNKDLNSTKTNSFKTNSLLLIQNGVYFATYLKNLDFTTSIPTYAIQEDVDARKIRFLFEDHKIKLINYANFVDLVLTHEKNITW